MYVVVVYNFTMLAKSIAFYLDKKGKCVMLCVFLPLVSIKRKQEVIGRAEGDPLGGAPGRGRKSLVTTLLLLWSFRFVPWYLTPGFYR